MPAATAPVEMARAGAARPAGWRPAGRRLAAVLLAVGSALLIASGTPCFSHGDEPAHSAELDAMIIRAAKRHGVPERLLRRIVMRESRYNPHARNHRYWGLMQISYPTARSMGFKGSPEELLNPLTNLTYAVPYLANAFIAAGKDESAAVHLYASGYYDTARRRGLLGLLRTAESTPVVNMPEPAMVQAGYQPEGGSLFGSLFGASEQPTPQPQISAATQAGMVQPVTAAEVADAGAAPRAGALPEGKATRGGALLALDRSGRSRPPAKWMRDGGLTLLARGEQGDRAFAAARVAAGDPPPVGHSRKNAVFASLDAPGGRPASAQAYAASASDETAATPPQAAISQALGSPAGPPAEAGSGNVGAAGRAEEAGKAEDDETPRRKHKHHAHHRGRHGHTREADAGDAAASSAIKP